jgi:hypothetical protein
LRSRIPVHRGEEPAAVALPNCVFVRDDARNAAQRVPAPVGFVLIANTFHGVPDKTALARPVHEVLGGRGRLAIVNWHPISREQTRVLGQPRGPATEMRMSLEQTRIAVEPAGFELKRAVELPPYHYGAVFARKS